MLKKKIYICKNFLYCKSCFKKQNICYLYILHSSSLDKRGVEFIENYILNIKFIIVYYFKYERQNKILLN